MGVGAIRPRVCSYTTLGSDGMNVIMKLNYVSTERSIAWASSGIVGDEVSQLCTNSWL
jgi:hypothetical protein